MNKLIEELAKQATRPRGPNKPSDFDKEYFAELIVRECAVELIKLGNSYSECDTDADYMQGMLDSADIIKEHFGVK